MNGAEDCLCLSVAWADVLGKARRSARASRSVNGAEDRVTEFKLERSEMKPFAPKLPAWAAYTRLSQPDLQRQAILENLKQMARCFLLMYLSLMKQTVIIQSIMCTLPLDVLKAFVMHQGYQRCWS